MSEIIWKDRKRPIFGLPLSFTSYSLSDERLFVKRGFLNLTEDEIRLYRIRGLKLTKSIGQRIFGVGSIQVFSSDKSLGTFVIESVKNPDEVKERLSNLVEAQRESKHVTSREYMGDGDFDEDTDGQFN
jgi:uncharacterized membrane protein YdbT with pleckstrin-like domain